MPNLINPDEFINPITKKEFLDLVLNLASIADIVGCSNSVGTEKEKNKEIAKFLTTNSRYYKI